MMPISEKLKMFLTSHSFFTEVVKKKNINKIDKNQILLAEC